eukprot:g4679.t1
MAAHPCGASFEGWLELRLKKLPIWRRRYCILHGAELRCFSSEGGKLKNAYSLFGLVPWDGEGRIFSYDANCALSLETTDGTMLQIICPSAHSREQWKLKVERAVMPGSPPRRSTSAAPPGAPDLTATATSSSAHAAAASNGGGRLLASAAGPDSVTMEDFSLVRVLGRGSFGKVMLVRKVGDQRLYAMKSLVKRKMSKLKQSEHVVTERRVAQRIRHPFLVNLAFAFQTAEKLYLVLDYMAGGDLYFWLQSQRCFSAQRVLLYAAEIVLGLEALHAQDVIYRDMKPENLLLDVQGHVHITDFGLAKMGVAGPGEEGGTKTLCGSPEYVAPEILRARPHGKAVDWWSLGAVLYEMLYGSPPFFAENKQQMFALTLHAPVQLPGDAPATTRALLLGLLNRDVSQRLGSGWQPAWAGGAAAGDGAPTAMPMSPDGSLGDGAGSGVGTGGFAALRSTVRGEAWSCDADEVKMHPYFAELDWARVLARGYSPMFVPPAQDDMSKASHFDTEFTDMTPRDSVVDPGFMQEAAPSSLSNIEGFSFDGRQSFNSGK